MTGWMLDLLVKLALPLWVAAIGLACWRMAGGPDIGAETIVVTGMAITGTLGWVSRRNVHNGDPVEVLFDLLMEEYRSRTASRERAAVLRAVPSDERSDSPAAHRSAGLYGG